jgi:hypothetical protein
MDTDEPGCEIERANGPLGPPRTAEPRRRWFRFSLRSFLLGSAAIAAAIGWTVHEAREQGIAVAALRQVGCEVEFMDDIGELTTVERLRKLLGESNFRAVTSIDARCWNEARRDTR